MNCFNYWSEELEGDIGVLSSIFCDSIRNEFNLIAMYMYT